MKSTKYQVFLSSTYSDLVEERESIIKAILEMYHIPIGMESSSPVVAGAAPSVPKHSPFHHPVILIAVAAKLLQTVQEQTDLVRTAEYS
ncbi:DUF4062 domain-containing protein [Laribacter hongkongensis]|uniref:DUF4062 domain-containing protein n=1 Tax=Laribacter hongkongensis TaxID=168471 RepID=UPI00281ECF65|nr:DUF4062 domain-containing protein [Laribacter hongkongensis]